MNAETETFSPINAETLNAPLRICFICTGNTCRSPMAAAAANYLCKGRVRAESAGISAFDGAPISPFAITALENEGIPSTPGNDYREHLSRRVDRSIIEGCDRVYCMSGRHMMALIGAFPEFIGKFSVMPHEISDPYGGSSETYELCLHDIIYCLKEMFIID